MLTLFSNLHDTANCACTSYLQLYVYSYEALPAKLSELLGIISLFFLCINPSVTILRPCSIIQYLALFNSRYFIIISWAPKSDQYWEDSVSKLLFSLLGEGREL